MNVIDKIEKEQCKPEVADFNIGDTVTVSTKIVEGNNERIQKFTGIVIARKNSGIRETFTVRRVSFGIGVEKVFPLHSDHVLFDENAIEIGAAVFVQTAVDLLDELNA